MHHMVFKDSKPISKWEASFDHIYFDNIFPHNFGDIDWESDLAANFFSFSRNQAKVISWGKASRVRTFLLFSIQILNAISSKVDVS